MRHSEFWGVLRGFRAGAALNVALTGFLTGFRAGPRLPGRPKFTICPHGMPEGQSSTGSCTASEDGPLTPNTHLQPLRPGMRRNGPCLNRCKYGEREGERGVSVTAGLGSLVFSGGLKSGNSKGTTVSEEPPCVRSKRLLLFHFALFFYSVSYLK